jgi:membrane-associated phospholipid phosphatase
MVGQDQSFGYASTRLRTATHRAALTVAALYTALIGYFRRDSGHNFRTDVIAGYCIGALVGYLVPRMHRKADADGLSLYPATVSGNPGVGIRVEY